MSTAYHPSAESGAQLALFADKKLQFSERCLEPSE